MVTKRNLIIILIMVFVLFGLFQFSLVMKDQQNKYDTNDVVYNKKQSDVSAYESTVFSLEDMKEDFAEDVVTNASYAVFLGTENSACYNTVKLWCEYRKMNLGISSIEGYATHIKEQPAVIFIEGEEVENDTQLQVLEAMEQKSVPMIFCSIPKVKDLKKNQRYMDILGIDHLEKEKVEVDGVHILEGFLLGGEAVYQSVPEMEEDPMDLDTTYPLYHVLNGSKKYMLGMYKKTPKETEKQPPLIWRYSDGNNQVFVVNGDYIKSISGMGYLSGLYAETKSYDLYPIVNAQVLTAVNYPQLADENKEIFDKLYSRSMTNVYQNLVWPSLIATMEESGFKPTCYMTIAKSEKAKKKAKKDTLVFFLKQLKEQNMEMGISLVNEDTKDVVAREKEYQKLMDDMNLSYKFTSAYVNENDIDALKQGVFEEDKNIRTVLCEKKEKDSVFEYIAPQVTRQNILFDATDFHFSNDIELMGYETALGYSNTLLDFTRLSWPETEEDQWQNFSKDFSSSLNSYWKKYEELDYVSAGEADRRFRRFLTLEYSNQREEDNIALHVNYTEGETCWFILKVNQEDIKKISGGSYKKIDANSYLITVEKADVNIELEAENETNFVY